MIKYFNLDLISLGVLTYVHVCWYTFTYKNQKVLVSEKTNKGFIHVVEK